MFLATIIVVGLVGLLLYYVMHKPKPFNPNYIPKTHWQKSSPYAQDFDTSVLADQILIDK